MINMEELSDIQQFFAGKTVFITGASGFLGKLILEKLLSNCYIEKAYILLRDKKGKDAKDRYNEFFKEPLFGPLMAKNPALLDKVTMISGDCTLPNIGLSDKDRTCLISEVNCIFHCAATVRFDEKLSVATFTNVRAVRDLLTMAKEMTQLKSFIHVSTAYSFCLRENIDEEFYKPLMHPDKLIKIAEEIDQSILGDITTSILGQWPNTYVFTKALAEELIRECSDLPIVMVRPSIVISTHKDPIPGWIDNVYGPTGVVVASAIGILRTLLAGKKKKADLVPADHVVNAIISASWDINCKKIQESITVDKKTEDPMVYNYVATPENPLDWETYMSKAQIHGLTMPTIKCIWIYILFLQDNPHINSLVAFFLHTIPAFFTDILLRLMGKKPMLMDAYKKIDKFTDVISFFSLKEWNFSNKNTQALWKKLSARDKELFHFSMTEFDWDEFFPSYLKGCRMYLVNDPLDTIEAANVKYKRLRIAHYAIVFVVGLLLLWACYGLLTLFSCLA